MKFTIIFKLLLSITILTQSLSLSVNKDFINWSRIIQGDTLPKSLRNINFPNIRGIDKRISGGAEAIPNSLPYQVGLNIQNKDNSIIWCGAALIWQNVILTAAHCLYHAKASYVFLGAHNIREDSLIVKVTSENFIIHPNYNPETLFNDIALIKLSNPVELNEKIQIIDLPSGNPNNFQDYLAIASGWGIYKDDIKFNSNTLRFVEVTVMNLEDCMARYKNVVRHENICIDGTKGKSTCSGDSGGPLVTIEETGQKILIGLTSFGSKLGCEKGWPAVFTRITSYLDWILENTEINL